MKIACIHKIVLAIGVSAGDGHWICDEIYITTGANNGCKALFICV